MEKTNENSIEMDKFVNEEDTESESEEIESEDQESPIENICRYCHADVDPDSLDIVHPCNCKSYLHKKCFNDYVKSKGKLVTNCEVCNQSYKFKKPKRRIRRIKIDTNISKKLIPLKLIVLLLVFHVFLFPYVVYINFDVLYSSGITVWYMYDYVPMKYCKCDPSIKNDDSVCFLVSDEFTGNNYVISNLIATNYTINNQTFTNYTMVNQTFTNYTVIPGHHECTKSNRDILKFANYNISLFASQGMVIYVIFLIMILIYRVIDYISNKYFHVNSTNTLASDEMFKPMPVFIFIGQLLESILATSTEILLTLVVNKISQIYYILIARQVLNALIYACLIIYFMSKSNINNILVIIISLILTAFSELIFNAIGIFVTQVVYHGKDPFGDPDWKMMNIYNFQIGILLFIIIMASLTIISLIFYGLYKLILWLFCEKVIELDNV
jgi:hypothetical protein